MSSHNELRFRLAAARVVLRRNHPALSVMVSYLRLVEAEVIGGHANPTACVSRAGVCAYNATWMNKLSDAELVGVLCHEALHPALNYFERLGARDPELANDAHDYCINLIIRGCGIALPPNVQIDDQFRSMSFEEIYDKLLHANTATKKHALSGDCDTKSIEQFLNKLAGIESDNATDAEQDERWKRILREAMRVDKDEGGGKFRGSLPNWAQSYIDGIESPRLTFLQQLKRMAGEFGEKELASFHRSNHRNAFQPHFAIRPGLRANRSKAFVLLDTSGSMTSSTGVSALKNALGAMQRITQECGMDIEIMQCDTRPTLSANREEITSWIAQQKMPLHGLGGSDFNEAFNVLWGKIRALGCAAPIIAFTDGEIAVPHCPPKDVRCKTYWVTPAHDTPPTHKWGVHVPLAIS